MTATSHTVHITRPCEITADDLHDAYLIARLRKLGIGYLQALETPAIAAALRGTAMMLKRQHAQPAANQQEIF